jgi:integrase
MRSTTDQSDQRLELSQLRRFWEEVYLPKLLRDGASSPHIERHRAAVNYAERFAKRPLSPGEIDEAFCLNFDSWLWRNRVSDRRRRDVVESLRRIVAAYQPDNAAIVSRRKRRPLPAPSADTYRGLWEQVYRPQRLAAASLRTHDDGDTVFYQLNAHFGRDLGLDEASDSHIAEHVAWLVDRGLRPSTINRHLSYWLAVWRFAHKRGLCQALPVFRKLPVELDEPDAWSSAELGRILEHVAAASPRPTIGGVPTGPYWRALILVCWYTAVRRRALLGLQWSDLDAKNGWLRVPATLMKGRRGKSFKLGADALVALAEIREPRRSLIFGGLLDNSTLHIHLRKFLDAAGVNRRNPGLQGFHKIRRSTATALAAREGMGAAQTALCHRHMSQTERYVDPTKLPGADFTKSLPSLRRTRATAG